MQLTRVFTAVLVALAAASSIQAAELSTPTDGNLVAIRAEQVALRSALADTKQAYKGVDARALEAAKARQQAVFVILDDNPTDADLDAAERAELGSAIQSLREALVIVEDSRLVCERVRVVGSNRPQEKCMSVGQRRALREEAQRQGLRQSR